MANKLASSNSPYLLQHAHNPVNWYPWSEEALAKACAEDKPIFLSIGYAACHWCHVMAHESFEDVQIASIMNESFINIKVDREERPDLDRIYMQAIMAMTGQGGWPMSVFITPDGKPFYGGTYFPAVNRYNLPSFSEVLLTIKRLWREDRSRILESGVKISDQIQYKIVLNQSEEQVDEAMLNQAAMNLAQTYDWKNGGWGKAPKFPQPMTIEYLLRRSTRCDNPAVEMAVHALHAMSKGGMYDVVGGGFSRYSTDDRWCTPHFEKMLYDNAQLALIYLHGWLVTGVEQFRRVCEETLDFLEREMTHPAGGFYSSLDADSEGEEGRFYVWTPAEIQAALINPQDIALVTSAYNITEAGNFEGKNVLQRVMNDMQLGLKFDLPIDTIPIRLSELHARLLITRSYRVRPGTDDKILVSWNALALAAFAEAGRYLDRADYLAIAQRDARFLLKNMILDGRIKRSWRAGRAEHNAYLEDYAAFVLGLLALYQSDGNPDWYCEALNLADEMVTHYIDPDGGFFDTRDDHEALLFRPKDLQDNATPSGNALAACALLQIAAYGDRPGWRNLVKVMLASIQEMMVRHPTAFAQWLCAADFAMGPVNEVAIIGDPHNPRTQNLLGILRKYYRPRQIVAISDYPPKPGTPSLVADRPLKAGMPTVYICQNFVCLQPINSPEDFEVKLDY